MKKSKINSIVIASGVALVSHTTLATTLLPSFESATFLPSATIDNLYFPLTNQPTRTYIGEKEEDGEIVTESFELSYGGLGRIILGVQTQTQLDRAFEDGLIVEETFDYYAQDTDGNVWYFGEDVTNYEYDDDDNLIGTNDASSWIGGINGALPGFIMPTVDALNVEYYQEFAPFDDATDKAEAKSSEVTVDIDFGTFRNVRQIFETNPQEPDSREYKYYAPGIGLILVEEGLDENLVNPEISVELVSSVSAVPIPASLPLISCALASLGVIARRRGNRVS